MTNTLLQNTAGVCMALVILEAVGRLAPKEEMVRFVRALAALALVGSAAASVLSLDWDLTLPEVQNAPAEELTAYVAEEAASAAARDAERYLTGLLEAGGISWEKIAVDTTIREDGSIDYTRVSAFFAYAADVERARALLRSTLGEAVEVEVKVLER